MRISSQVRSYLEQVQLPEPTSHKGENGKLLIIGGSELFHAASKWSLDIASKFVDMVFYSSVPTNNELVKQAKAEFWNGIVIGRKQIESYLAEADCILIGPGMDRSMETTQTVNHLVSHYPDKKWVIDAGGLQEIDPQLLRPTMIITPHKSELIRVLEKTSLQSIELDRLQHLSSPLSEADATFVSELLKKIQSPTTILKGPIDYVFSDERIIAIEGGNAGMTKGGTGDVLAGIIAALYCTHDATTATVVGSIANKQAGELLYEQVGPYFSASDLVRAVPVALWNLVQGKRLT